MAKIPIEIAEARVFDEHYPVFLTEVEFERVRPRVYDNNDNVYDVYANGGYDPLSGAMITVNKAGYNHILDIMEGRPRERLDDVSNHMTFHSAYPRYVSPNDIVELYDAFQHIEFERLDDIVKVYECLMNWQEEMRRYKITSIGYKGLSLLDQQKLDNFVNAIRDKAQAITIRNINQEGMTGAWSEVARLMLQRNLLLHNPDYLSGTFSDEFRKNDTRSKVLTRGSLRVSQRVSDDQ